MRLIWAEGAITDLIQIRDYIAEYNPDAAEAIALRLLEIAELLPGHPLMGVATLKQGIRRLVVPQSVYSLIYRIADDDVEIIEVFDGRRKSPQTDISA